MNAPRFLADENLRRSIVTATRRREPALEFRDAVSAGLAGQPDDRVLEFASEAGLIVVSHDVNTMTTAAKARIVRRSAMAGLFLVRQDALVREIAECLLTVWAASSADEWHDRIVFLPF